MAELKTQKNDVNVIDYLSQIEPESKRTDSLDLFKVFQEAVSESPAMWGASIIGFGEYHYKSDRSTQEGDWPLTGFSPRKQNISIYIMPGINKYPELLAKLGKHKVSKGSCLYINKLSDINTEVLKTLIHNSVQDMKKIHGA